jgi:hypothetical protein
MKKEVLLVLAKLSDIKETQLLVISLVQDMDRREYCQCFGLRKICHLQRVASHQIL